MLAFGPLFQISAFFIQYLGLPFPMFVLAFGLGGIGMVFQVLTSLSMKDFANTITNPFFDFVFLKDASANGFIATLQKDSEYKMGWIHAAYGNSYS
jgi:hypothetical protein